MADSTKPSVPTRVEGTAPPDDLSSSARQGLSHTPKSTTFSSISLARLSYLRRRSICLGCLADDPVDLFRLPWHRGDSGERRMFAPRGCYDMMS